MAINRVPIFDALREMLGRGLSPSEVARMDLAIDKAEGVSAVAKTLAEAGAFYKGVRSAFGPLTQSQVDGFTMLLGAFGEARWPLAWAAYGLATAWHETNERMEPVREAYWLSEDWRQKNLRYWPWYGRGFVQLTWKPNYEKADEELGLNGALIADPDCALRIDIAARVMVHGMEAGWFTKKKLADYLPLAGQGGFDAFKGARYIINGTDKNEKIAKEALAFQGALLNGGWL